MALSHSLNPIDYTQTNTVEFNAISYVLVIDLVFSPESRVDILIINFLDFSFQVRSPYPVRPNPVPIQRKGKFQSSGKIRFSFGSVIEPPDSLEGSTIYRAVFRRFSKVSEVGGQ